jgi:hypothetical protein
VAPPVAGPVAYRPGAGGEPLHAFLAARVSVRYDDPGIDEREEFAALYGPLDGGLDLERETVTDFDFPTTAPAGATYVLPDAPIAEAAFFRDAERAIKRRIVSDRLEARRDRLEAALAQAQRRVEELTLEERAREATELAAGAGALLGALLGGRRRTRSIAGALDRSARGAERPRSAEGKVTRAYEDQSELEAQLAAELQEIDARWRALAGAIETVSIRPEAADVHVERLLLVWAPVTPPR